MIASQRSVNFIEILNGHKELESGEVDLILSAIQRVVVRDDSACVYINIQIQQLRGCCRWVLILIRHKLLDYHFRKHKLSG